MPNFRSVMRRSVEAELEAIYSWVEQREGLINREELLDFLATRQQPLDLKKVAKLLSEEPWP